MAIAPDNRSKRRMAARLGALLPRWLARKRSRLEARALADLVLARVSRATSDQRAFVERRFVNRVAAHGTMGPRHALVSMSLNIVTVGGGATTSTLAATGDADSGLLIFVGLLVAFAGATNQIGRFGQRAAVRFRAGNQLRREGWDFAVSRGRYKDLDYADGSAFAAFYDVIWTIEQPADAIAEAPPDQN